jgi:hypothetical protein
MEGIGRGGVCLKEVAKEAFREGSVTVETQTTFLQAWANSCGVSLLDGKCSKA